MNARKRTERHQDRDTLAAFKRDLKEHNCLSEFDELAQSLGSEPCLIKAILSLRLAFDDSQRVQNDPSRMDSRKLRTLLQKTRWVARAWERQCQTPFGQEVFKLATKCDPSAGEEDFLKIPQRLLSLTDWASDIHRKTKHRQRPLYDDNLAELVEWVKIKSGTYHDRQVSALVGWAVRTDTYDENTLRVWRNEHAKALSRARLRVQQR